MWQTFKRQFQRYLDLSNWIVRDSYALFGKTLVFLQVERFLGVGLQLAVFGVLAGYAQRLENDTSVQFFSIQFQPRESPELLILVAGAAIVGLLLAAGLTYHSHVILLRVCRAYEEHCSRRILERIIGPYAVSPHAFAPEAVPRPITLAQSDARHCARVIYRLNNAVIPSCIVGLLTLPILFFLQPGLTMLVTLLSAASLSLHYHTSRRSAIFSREREHFDPAKSRILRAYLDQAGRQIFPLHPEMINETFSQQAVRRSSRAFFARLDAIKQSRLFSDLMTALILVAVLVILGRDILSSKTGWGTLIIYLLALRMSMNHLAALMRAMTAVNRFYYQVRRYFLFLQATKPTVRETESETFSSNNPFPPVRLGSAQNVIPESDSDVRICPGDCFGLLTALPLNRFTLSLIMAGLFPDSPDHHASIAQRTAVIPDQPELPAGYTWQEVVGSEPFSETAGRNAWPVPAAGAERVSAACWARSHLPPQLDTSIVTESRSGSEQVSDLLAACLIVAARPFSVILISLASYTRLDPDSRVMLKTLWADRIIGVVADNLKILDCPEPNPVILLSPTGVTGLGDQEWAQRHRERLAGELRDRKAQDQGAHAGWRDADDEDDDDE